MKKKEKEMRFMIDYAIFKKYKLICCEMDLSIPKQTAALIEHFVKVQSENLEKIRDAQKEK
jgi:hypothetical protein